MLKVIKPEAGMVGVDSGQIMVIAEGALGCWSDTADEPRIPWPSIILNDGRKFTAGGKDFFNWDHDRIGDTGKSANQLLKEGRAVHVDPQTPLINPLSYDGACNATLGASGFGFLAEDAVPRAFCFRTLYGDGGYVVSLVQNALARYVIVDTSEPKDFAAILRTGRLVCLGAIKTDGQARFCDPCQTVDGPTATVIADAEGYSRVFGVIANGEYRLSGVALQVDVMKASRRKAAH